MNSLCIPRTMNFTTTVDVTKVFNKLFGAELVERVDERNLTDARGQTFKMFYIHFTSETTQKVEFFKEKLAKDGMINVMTGKDKWFWKVYLNKSTKANKPVRTGPRVMTEEDEEMFLKWKESKMSGRAEEPKVQPVEYETPDEFIEGFTEEELFELELAVIDNYEDEDELMAIADVMALADVMASEE